MKKVININFQGRILPIEESAYDMLKQYVDSLRRFFANEEGRDEIINDIEGRIAELFDESLKKGKTCITDDEVNTVIASMGRPEDFDADENIVKAQLEGEAGGGSRDRIYERNTGGAKTLYRDENNKFLGGVCSGIGAYTGIDPVIIRVLFVLFFGVTFLAYLILWVAVPSTSSVVIGSQRKRLFRDADSKILGGVCSGLAQYFSVQIWVPRLLFLIPFFSLVFRWGNWGVGDFPHLLSFSFSPGSIVIYIIFWLVIPEAKSTADKLEMKGEKVDLNNIKSTIQGDLEGFKDRAQTFGNELKERAQVVGQNISDAGKRVGGESAGAAKRTGNGLVNVLGVLLKIFVYFIVGSIIFAIVVALFTGGVILTGLLPAYSFVLEDGLQKILAWGTLIFFIWVPVIAIVTWIIRRIAGKKSSSSIISLTFFAFWIVGIICFVNLLVALGSSFRYRNTPTEQVANLSNPGINKLEVKSNNFNRYYYNDWFNFEPFSTFDDDSVYVKNVRIRITKSTTDSFQVNMVRMSNGNSRADANQRASLIKYAVLQRDSTLYLDKGIAITSQDKFRNQQVIVTIAVPVGKRIKVGDKIGLFDNVHIDMGRGNNYWDWENSLDNEAFEWRRNVEYVMTTTGLERVLKQLNVDEDNSDRDILEELKRNKEDLKQEIERQQRELDEKKRELEKTGDTTYKFRQTTYRYKETAEKTVAAVKTKRATKSVPQNSLFINTMSMPLSRFVF